ncbi:MAG TPA: TetR/AcrR family transcriptional regulator C-terminal domain-containing protein [Arachnia sp.]|nr:TetR/AcrR family transcriptional regulator C-terminal domain-containing protein [Arachnia sp.]HMT85040.1 TetR/AcrR family transcriptional regulator C-terminal domain-containing protein [Arachnia sp.]
MALSRAAIVEAGLSLLDDYGLADLTMRRVGDALGVKAGALYYHVPNKQSLLAAVSDEILAEQETPDGDLPPAEWLTAWAINLRETLLRHRDAAELVASSMAMGLGHVDPRTAGRRYLVDAGLPDDTAFAVMRALLHLVLGQVTEEQTRRQMVDLGLAGAEVLDDYDAQFRFAIGLLVQRAP